MGSWVLIFISLHQSVPIIGQVQVGTQPVYFHTKAACDAVAAEFNNGPEPTKDTPRERQKPFGAICRATGA